MSTRKAIGQLKSTGKIVQMDFEWQIPDFLSLSAEEDEYERFYSSTFSFCDSSWYLRLHPNGEEREHSIGYVGVYVCRGDSGPPVAVTYSLFFKKTDGRRVIVEEETGTFEKEVGGWGEPEAIYRRELIDHKCEFLPSGVLTVLCSLKFGEARGAGGTEKLAGDFRDLLEGGDGSDVTIGVQGQEFRLHRSVLAARTPVFSSMFKHDMQEKATGVVTVVDCEAGPFRTFVQYLYTASTAGITPENVFALYTMADKYQVDELKSSCLDCMKNTLSVDTFCETLVFALQHEEQDLVERATEFLSENASEIMGREDWQTLLKSNTKRLCECLGQAFVKKDKNKQKL